MARHTRPEADDAAGGGGRQRLDKWLVYARFARTRSLACALIEGGRVRLNGSRVTRPDRALAPGDILTLALAHATTAVRVLSVAERRGSFPEARTLYEDLGGSDHPTVRR